MLYAGTKTCIVLINVNENTAKIILGLDVK
jgi:hypothetical protein